MKRKFKISEIENIPKDEGIYYFYEGKDIVYIGYSSNLYIRMKNHFEKTTSFHEGGAFCGGLFKSTVIEYEKITHVKVKLWENLEVKEIRKYKPKYNGTYT